ncbi:MAG: DUF1553 domain-containing protein, partial [Bacteroidota bacterium]
QGDKPTHPELLDWLAVQLVKENGWRLKPLIKKMVLSATYRQATHTDKTKLEKDPLNQWLTRAHRTRLSAEQIRDQLLAVSGLLDSLTGGPPVAPKSLGLSANRIPAWAISGPAAERRRTLYSFWRRTEPFPAMMTFDSPDRTLCSSRRIRTNTPLQALNLLNHETYFEAAKQLAQKHFDPASSATAQIKELYRQLYYKNISAAQLQHLLKLHEAAVSNFAKAPQEVIEMFPTQKDRSPTVLPQIGALSMVANALLNLDAFVVKN